LVASYRSQFGSQIAQKGIDPVIEMIAQRNKVNGVS
jgi:ABC-type transporter MlaC component